MNSVKGARQAQQAGPVVLAPESYTRPVDSGLEPRLLGNRCPRCERVFFPARNLCPDCFEKSELVPNEMSGMGHVYASTVVRINAPVGIEAPYAYGYVDLDVDEVRVFALFTGAEPEWFKPGRRVKPVVEAVRKNKEGREVICYKFAPLDGGSAND